MLLNRNVTIKQGPDNDNYRRQSESLIVNVRGRLQARLQRGLVSCERLRARQLSARQ